MGEKKRGGLSVERGPAATGGVIERDESLFNVTGESGDS